MLQDFYNNVVDDEDTFLGHLFVDSDMNDESNFTDDESNGVPKKEPIEDGREEKDNDDVEDEEIFGDDNNNNEVESVVYDADDAKTDDPMSAKLPKKQEFSNLDKVLNEDYYADLPAQKTYIQVCRRQKNCNGQLGNDSKSTIISTT